MEEVSLKRKRKREDDQTLLDATTSTTIISKNAKTDHNDAKENEPELPVEIVEKILFTIPPTTVIEQHPDTIVSSRRVNITWFLCSMVCRLWRDILAPHLPASALPSPSIFMWCAASEGWVSLMQWARGRGGCALEKNASLGASAGGQMKVLRWLMWEGCAIEKTASLCASARGQLGVLQWLKKQGHPICNEASSAAAQYGHLKVLQWLKKQGHPICNAAPAAAAQHGHLKVLQWLLSPEGGGCALGDSARGAACGGKVKVLRWLRQQGHQLHPFTMAHAAQHGHLKVLQWWERELGSTPWDNLTACNAAKGGMLHVLQWLHVRGCPMDTYTLSYAASGGHVAVLEWLREKGVPLDNLTFASAAGMGKLDALLWLREVGCPYCESACLAAAAGGHMAVLTWLKEIGIPMDVNSNHWRMVVATLMKKHDVDTLDWLKQEGCFAALEQ